MTDDSLAGLDFDSLNAETTAATAEAAPPAEPEPIPPKTDPPQSTGDLPPLEGIDLDEDKTDADSQKRPLWEVLSIFGGVFVVVGIFAWIMVTFVFAEKPDEETTLELPRNRMEAMLMELPAGEIQTQKIDTNKAQPTVFIVEIDASIIVKGTYSELVEVESLLKSHHRRIEEVIEETVRSASEANLTEPEMIVIRTRVRDRINAFFDRPLVKEVLFSHYRAFHTPVKMGT